MKLSEAIVELEKAIKEHGDIELSTEYCGQVGEANDLWVFADDKPKSATFSI